MIKFYKPISLINSLTVPGSDEEASGHIANMNPASHLYHPSPSTCSALCTQAPPTAARVSSHLLSHVTSCSRRTIHPAQLVDDDEEFI